MDKIFQKIIHNNFSDLKGTTVDASIPVPQYLINELITEVLKRKQKHRIGPGIGACTKQDFFRRENKSVAMAS